MVVLEFTTVIAFRRLRSTKREQEDAPSNEELFGADNFAFIAKNVFQKYTFSIF